MIAETALAAAAALIASAALTAMVRKAALARRVLDVPNDRSSHTVPTPRGGGLAIVVTLLSAVAVLGAAGAIEPRFAAALLMSGTAIALVGFIDDQRQVGAPIRLAVHFAAVSLYVWLEGILPPLNFGFAVADLGVFGVALGVVVLVWFLNLFNFMDGIDGIAGVEAISIALAAATLTVSRGAAYPTPLLLLLTAAAAGGFLIWNWPPARIFMGDAGSGFLGFSLGAIAWASVVKGELSIWVWLILFGACFMDATVTLLRRWGRGERLAEAHRSHAYQRLSRRLGSHKKVTFAYLAVNVLWLSPLAWLAAAHVSLGALLMVVAWAPLVIIAWRCGAGLPGP